MRESSGIIAHRTLSKHIKSIYNTHIHIANQINIHSKAQTSKQEQEYISISTNNTYFYKGVCSAHRQSEAPRRESHPTTEAVNGSDIARSTGGSGLRLYQFMVQTGPSMAFSSPLLEPAARGGVKAMRRGRNGSGCIGAILGPLRATSKCTPERCVFCQTCTYPYVNEGGALYRSQIRVSS